MLQVTKTVIFNYLAAETPHLGAGDWIPETIWTY